MARHVTIVGMAMVVLIAAGGCAQRRPQHSAGQGGWQLMHPPEVRDERYPRGYRIQSDAPLNAWHTDAAFATREECEQAMLAHIDDSIDRARAAYGADARNELTVRRAVNARCVQAK